MPSTNNVSNGATDATKNATSFNVISTREFQNRKNVDTRPTNPEWNPMECIAAFPSRRGSEAIDELKLVHENMFAEKGVRKKPSLEEFEGKPIEVDAPMEERMRELLADRSKLCIYDERLQKAQVLHFPAAKGTRLLTHFYAFVFFADWRADLWSKRFVRDHLRYIDEVSDADPRLTLDLLQCSLFLDSRLCAPPRVSSRQSGNDRRKTVSSTRCTSDEAVSFQGRPHNVVLNSTTSQRLTRRRLELTRSIRLSIQKDQAVSRGSREEQQRNQGRKLAVYSHGRAGQIVLQALQGKTRCRVP